MILHSVHVENYKGIRGPLHVTFDSDAPNLIDGPNGAGKSTLVEAIECCLVEGYNTAGAAAEGMRPRQTALTPMISVVFTHDGSVYRISKTFLDAPKAELERRGSNGEFQRIAKGKDADEQVRAMLRSQATKAKDKAGERLGFFSVLCSTQGKQELPALNGDALTDIREMLGAQVAGSRGTAFEAAVGKKYFLLWNPGGTPKKGKLSEIRVALVTAREHLDRCAASMQQVSNLESSARLQRELHKGALARMELAQGEYQTVAELAKQVIDLRTRRTPAVSRVQSATARYDQVRSEIDHIIATATKKKMCEEARPGLDKGEADARSIRDRCATLVGSARADWDAASGISPEIIDLERRIELATVFLQLVGELGVLEERLERASRSAARQRALLGQIEGLNAPDPATWLSIESIGHDFDEAKLHLESLALRLDIAAEADLAVEVLDGEPSGMATLPAGQDLGIKSLGQMEVRLPGIATLRLSGPSGDAAHWRARLDENQSKLAALMSPFGAASWRELIASLHKREKLSIELVAAQAEYAAAIGPDDISDLERRKGKLVEKRLTILSTEPLWSEQPPDVDRLKATASAKRLEWQDGQSKAAKAWETAEKSRSAAEAALVSAEAARRTNDAALAELVRELAALEADGKSMAERQHELNSRRRECESAEASLAEIDTALAPLAPDAPEHAAAMAQNISAIEQEIQKAREAFKQDERVVSEILQQGPYSSLAVAEERVRQLELDEFTETARLDAIKRLRTAIDAAKNKVLAGIAKPVEERATALLERIVGRPLAQIRLGDSMKLASVQPDGCSQDAPVDEMSSGEREQIYFATRLALADVLGTKERQVVVLDDPLVDTDADRLARALQLIHEREERLQFVILSCHPERYLALPKLASQHLAKFEAQPEVATPEVGP
jgi:ABC-type transport system involved in cytochrome c biogenesis ATPase subunit